jgi:hypothetical protein
MRSAFFSAALTALVFCLPVTAQADAKSEPAAAAAPAPAAPPAAQAASAADAKGRMEALAKTNPDAAKLITMAQDLYNSLPRAEAQRLVTVRTGATMIRVAEMANGDIGKTVDLCDKANPSMKKDLDAQYAAFRGKVMPEVGAQQKKLQAAIDAKGNFTHPAQVRAFLDQMHKTMVSSKEQNDKNLTRVTTPEACGELGKSMDKNGGTIVEALQKIEWPAAPAPGKAE